MVGKIVHSNGVVQVDWSTLKKNERERKFEETLTKIQEELVGKFKVGTKVTSIDHYVFVGFESKELAEKVGAGIVRYDNKNKHFIKQSVDESTLVDFFNSKHEFIVVGTENVDYQIVLSFINFSKGFVNHKSVDFYDDIDWEIELPKLIHSCKLSLVFVDVSLHETDRTILSGKKVSISVPCTSLQIKTD